MIVKILFLVLFFQAQDIRDNYAQASETKEKSASFLRKLEKINKKSDANLQAYKGAALIISAKYESGIFQKTKLVREGISWIEDAVKLDSKDAEIRMIRHSIQSNIPKILGYYNKLEEDRKYLQSNLSKIEDEALKRFLSLYLKNAK